jgi:acyl-homoserine-lactone acylase
MDGKRKEFEESSKIIRIKQDDGTMVDKEIPLLKTVHGPVVNKTEDKVLALRMVGLDKPNMFLQWWRMINSSTFNEFEDALKMAQIPFWNVMYADKSGEIFYLFNGLVPKRTEDSWDYWDRIIPGGKSADVWTEVHDYADLPKVKNPEGGWLQNANDPPWTSTIPMSLNPDDYPGYMAPQSMPFRPQRSARMLIEDASITFDELVDYKLSTRLEFADRILDDLFAAVDASDSEMAKQAKVVLEHWDREADADSKGMLLFYSWARKFNVWQSSNYVTQWSLDAPNTTPDGLADPARAVELLEETANELHSKYGSLDTPWGDYYRINYNGKDLPANGIDGSMGVFRVAWPGDADEDHMYVGGGDSWVGVIEFGDKVNAKVLLSYGNATQKDSPHNGDQLELFSKKELRDAWFTKEQVKANTSKVEILTENGFNEKKINKD